MRKGERTRAEIIRRAAVLFNTRGFAGATLSQIMAATGLEKGGIYRHFRDKDELALAAFDHAVELVNQRYREALAGKRNAVERLRAIVDTFRHLEDGRPIGGGCPIMNTAIDSDDTHPALRGRAKEALEDWRAALIRIVASGRQRGEVRPDVYPQQVADTLIASLEGALMMSRLLADSAPMRNTLEHLQSYLQEQVAPGRTTPEPTHQ